MGVSLGEGLNSNEKNHQNSHGLTQFLPEAKKKKK